MAQGVLPWGVSLLRKLLGQIGNLAIQSSRGRCSFREKDGSSGLAICELSQFWPDQAWLLVLQSQVFQHSNFPGLAWLEFGAAAQSGGSN